MKKVIEFLKENWQKILLFVASLVFIAIGLCSRNCGPTLKAYQTNIDNIYSNKSYAIFTYDEIVLGTNSSPLFFSLPVTNKYYETSLEQTYTNQLIMNYDNTEVALVRLSNPYSYMSAYYFNGFATNYVSLRSDYMYIPPNLNDYYFEIADVISFGGLNEGLTPLDVRVTFDIDYGGETMEHIEDIIRVGVDNGSFSIMTFGELDISALVFDRGCIIRNYSLTLDLRDQVFGSTSSALTSIVIEKAGMISLPNEPLYMSFSEVCEVCPNYSNIGTFLTNSIGAFMDFEIFPGFSISGLLASIMAIGLFILFLKVFAGG